MNKYSLIKKLMFVVLIITFMLIFFNTNSCEAYGSYLWMKRIPGYQGLIDAWNGKETSVGNIIMTVDKESNIQDYKDLILEGLKAKKGSELTEEEKAQALSSSMYLVRNSDEVYCVQHEASMYPQDYIITHFIRIEGKKVTVYQHTSNTERPIDSNNEIPRERKYSLDGEYDENAVLAYLLNSPSIGRGYGFWSGPRQYAIRHYFTTWIKEVGEKVGVGTLWGWDPALDRFGNPEWVAPGEAFIKEAESSVNSGSYSPASVEIKSPNNKKITLNKITSELKTTINFTGTLSINVTNVNNRNISNDIIYKQDNKEVSVSQIKPNKELTIINNSGTRIKNIRFSTSNTVYSANIWLAKSKGYFVDQVVKDGAGKPVSASQRFMVVDRDTADSSDYDDLTVDYDNGDLIINKVDEDNQSINLNGAKFIIKNQNGNWLTKVNGSYGETTTQSSATVFETNDDGKTTDLKLLPDGNYQIYEVDAPGKYDKTLQQFGNNTYDLTNQYIYWGEVTVSKGEDTTPTISNKLYGKITINKMDYDKTINKEANSELNGAKFKLHVGDFKFVGLKNGEWVYDATFSEAYVFETGSTDSNCKWVTATNGSVTIKKLKLNITYEIWEVDAPENYDLTMQKDYKIISDDTGQQYGYVLCNKKLITANDLEGEFYITNRLYGAIKINKTVQKIGKQDPLDGAKFKICINDGQNHFLGMDSNGNWTYDATWDTAEVFTTGGTDTRKWVVVENGCVIIKRLDMYKTYGIIESETPLGYNIIKQDDYITSFGNVNSDMVYNSDKHSVTLNVANTPQNINFINKKIIDIDGYVFEDVPDGKANVTDNEYNAGTNDRLLSGIKVHLKNTNGLDLTAITDSNGYYKFTDIDYYANDLDNGYIEFEYDNKNYTTVEINDAKDTATTKYSKAKPYTITENELIDNNLTGTEGALPGRAVTEGKVQKLEEYIDNANYKITNVNLGLLEKIEPEYAVSENLEYIKLKMKGYTYTYKYGDSVATNSPYAPTVNNQTGAKTFSAAIYPTDVAYNSKNAEASDKLQVYVVYSVSVKNTETLNIKDKYVEGKLYLDSLENSFDKERYSLCNNENNSDNKDFALWSINGDKAKYDVNNANSPYKDGLLPNEIKTSYIQFKMKDEAVQKILNKQLREQDIQEAPSVTNVMAYHEYIRADRVWNHNTNKASSSARYMEYNGVKGTYNDVIDRNVKETCYVHKSISLPAKSSDLYIRFSLGQARKLTGTVFEDTLTEKSKKQDGSDESKDVNLGNGILDAEETGRAQDVKVELLNSAKQKTALYKVNTQTGAVTETSEAVVTTKAGEKYEFEGVVPGYYYIKFTYGDGTQKMMPANEAISAIEYRSTIVNTSDNGGIIRNAMEANDAAIQDAQNKLVADYKNESAKKLVEWYKYLDKDYSTAIDSLEQRKQFEDLKATSDGRILDKDSKDVTDTISKINVDAFTPIIGISIENDLNNETVVGVNKNEFSKFNFGLIKPTPTVTTIEKKITNVKLIGQVGTTIVSANPTDKMQNYITALDSIAGGSVYAKLEIDPENIYGSSLETSYEVTVKNESVKDYIEKVEEGNSEYGTFYKYGIITDNATLKKVTIDEVVDNLDQKYNVKSLPETTTQTVTKSETKYNGNTINIEPSTNTTKIIDDDGTEKTVTEVKISGWESLETSETSTINYTVTSLISRENDDTKYENGTKITLISLDKLTTLKSDLGEAKLTKLTITPTTGRNRNNMYLISAFIGLVVVAIGVGLINKRIS